MIILGCLVCDSKVAGRDKMGPYLLDGEDGVNIDM